MGSKRLLGGEGPGGPAPAAQSEWFPVPPSSVSSQKAEAPYRVLC